MDGPAWVLTKPVEGTRVGGLGSMGAWPVLALANWTSPLVGEKAERGLGVR